MLSRLSRGGAASGLLRISEEVRAAVAANAAVVALESTIFTSGMPRPTNVDTALEVERIVRSRGAVPATVGLLGGRLVVGLSQAEITALGEDTGAVKCSTRDLPTAMARRLNGGTTVSATLVAAELAGVPLFVTGGVGGVHRLGEATMDVSADLTQLGRTPVMTVCAGVKAFLDVGRTLEALETQGVGVATLLPGGTDQEAEFPAFYTPGSGNKSPCTLHSVAECARVLRSVVAIGQSGFLLAVPIPEAFRRHGDAVDAAIREALAEAKRLCISGKAVTPFLLDRVNRLTGGESLRANVALMKQNADVGARISVEFARLIAEETTANGEREEKSRPTDSAGRATAKAGADAVVIGGCNLDVTARLAAPTGGAGFPSERTHPGSLVVTCGGVGRNIADALARCGHRPVLLSALGRDHTAELHARLCPHLDWSAVRRLLPDSSSGGGDADGRSAAYAMALRSDGSLLFGVADMAAHEAINAAYLDANEAAIAAARVVCCDANSPAETVLRARQLARRHGVEFWFEPTDTDKAEKLFAVGDVGDEDRPLCDWTTPNSHELLAMQRMADGTVEARDEELEALEPRRALAICRRLVAAGVAASFVVKLGPRGLLLVPGRDDPLWGGSRPIHCTAATCQRVVSVSGAGDSLVGGFLAARLSGRGIAEAAAFASLCARASLLGYEAVSPQLADLAATANSDGRQLVRRADITVTFLE